jgi:flagellar biogenesis protein FliO
VLGVAPGQVSKLHEMPKGVANPAAQSGSLPAGQDFAAWLKRTMERRNSTGGK